VSQTKAELIKGLNINASAPATALQIDASGNVNIDSNTLYVDATNNRVGLGTSSPSTKLHVNSADSSATYLRVENTSGQAYFGVDGSGNTYAGAETNDAFGLVTNGSYRMYITSGGNVGIGTTSPSQRLHVANSADNVKLLVSSGFEAALELQNGGGSEVNVINSAGTGNLSFRVSNSEKMRMDSSGRLLVGTSSSSNSNALIQMYVASGTTFIEAKSASISDAQQAGVIVAGGARTQTFAVFKHSGITNPCGYLGLICEDNETNYLWADNSDVLRISTVSTNIGTTGGTVVGAQTSDERLKNILGPVEHGLDTLKQIEPVRYALKSEPDTEKLGFIAQQVQPLVPQSVFDTGEHIEGEPEDAPTKLGMEYVALIPVLVNAIKELSAEVDALKAQLQAQ